MQSGMECFLPLVTFGASWCAVLISDHMLIISVSHRLYSLSSGIPLQQHKSIPSEILRVFFALLGNIAL